jgi:hypothetical protein
MRTFAGSGIAGTVVYVSTLSNTQWRTLGKTVAGKRMLQSSKIGDGIYFNTSAWAVDAPGNASSVSTPFCFDVWKEGLAAPTLSLPVHAPTCYVWTTLLYQELA